MRTIRPKTAQRFIARTGTPDNLWYSATAGREYGLLGGLENAAGCSHYLTSGKNPASALIVPAGSAAIVGGILTMVGSGLLIVRGTRSFATVVILSTAPITDAGRGFVPILNSLGLDAMAAHWEFAYGPETFKHCAAKLNYLILAINVYEKASSQIHF